MSEFTRYEVNPRDLKTEEPFSILFEIKKANLDAIRESMTTHGYDQGQPIAVWHGVVVDGHTRLQAAKLAKIRAIPCIYHEFKDEDEALAYAFSRQADRRNTTDADIMRAVGVIDNRKTKVEAAAVASAAASITPHGVMDEPAPPLDLQNQASAKKPRSSSQTAKIIGVSERKVERVRTIADRASAETKAAVLAGTKTINAAYNETVKPKEPKPKVPKPKPRAKVPDDIEALKARIAELEAENADLQERCSEAANLMQTLQEENEAMQRTLDAEDLRGAFQKEVARAHERARIAESRCTGLTVEVNELKGFCKMWKGKFERLEKASRKSQEEADGLAS